MHNSSTRSGLEAEGLSENATDKHWRRSTACASNGCLEVAFGPGAVFVRDSKLSDGPVLAYNHEEWQAFLAGVRKGEFDLADS